MTNRHTAKITAVDVMRLVEEFDNITARLWRGFPYKKEHLERPDFLDFVARRTSGFAAMADSVKSLRVSRTRGDRIRKNITSLAKPTQQDLAEYARDFDRGRLLALLKELSRAAVAWDVDPGPFIELRGAVLVVMAGGSTDSETDSVKNPAWTKVRELELRAEAAGTNNDEPETDPNRPPKHKLEVNLTACFAILDGNRIELRPNQAKALDLLIRNKKPYMSLADNGLRSREIDKLPTALKELVETQPGAGTRIRREKVEMA